MASFNANTLKATIGFGLGLIAFLLFFGMNLSATEYVYCKETQQLGLFEQCFEVKVIKQSKDRLHVYSYGTKMLLNVSSKEVFEMIPLTEDFVIDTKSHLLIPGDLMWTSAKPKTQSLCAVSSLPSATLAEMKCSSKQKLVVKKSLMNRMGASYSEGKSQQASLQN